MTNARIARRARTRLSVKLALHWLPDGARSAHRSSQVKECAQTVQKRIKNAEKCRELM